MVPRRKKGRLSNQVKEEILQKITEEQIGPGEKLPSEEQLAQELDVSRPTLREALRMLETEGFVERKQGKGTFVLSRTHLESGLEHWRSISAIIEGIAKKVGTRILGFQEGTFGKEVHLRLQISEDELCVRLERVRTADLDPVSLSLDYIPRRVFGYRELTREHFSGSLVRFMEESCGVRVLYSKTHLIPVVACGVLAKELSIPEQSAVLLLDEVHYGENHQVVFWGKEYFPYEKVKFHMIRRRVD